MRYQRRILAVLVVLLLVTSMLPAKWAQAVADGPTDVKNAILVPAGWLRSIGDALRGRGDRPADPVSMETLRKNLDETRRYNEELKYHLEKANRQIELLSQIRRRAGLAGLNLLPASVLEWNNSRAGPLMSIDCGRRHGVAEGQVVIADDLHLMGRVVHAAADSAVVRPITSPRTHLAVVIRSRKPREQGREPSPLQIHAVPGGSFLGTADTSDLVNIGDVAHLHDQTWPDTAQGFFVGVVTAIDPDPDDPILRSKVRIVPIKAIAETRDVVVAIPRQVEAAPQQP